MEKRKREMNEEKLDLITRKVIDSIKEFMPTTECDEDRMFDCVDIAYALSNTLAIVLCGVKSKAIAYSLVEYFAHKVKGVIDTGFEVLEERENAEENKEEKVNNKSK